MTPLIIGLIILPKLPATIDMMLMIIDIIESMTVTTHAQPLPVIRPHAITELAIPRAITTELIAIIPLTSKPPTSAPKIPAVDTPKAPPAMRIIPLTIIRIATIVTPNGRLLPVCNLFRARI